MSEVPIHIIHLGQDDPRKCTARLISSAGLAKLHPDTTRSPSRGILLDPTCGSIQGPEDRRIIDMGGSVVALDCSWKHMESSIESITNSTKLVRSAVKEGADYVALGSFFTTKTKKVKFVADFKTLRAVKKFSKITVVAIGGINHDNYRKVLLNKANFLAISNYIWKNKTLSPEKALNKLK